MAVGFGVGAVGWRNLADQKMAPKAAAKNSSADKILASALPVHKSIESGDAHSALLKEKLITLMKRRSKNNVLSKNVRSIKRQAHTILVLIANTAEALKVANQSGGNVYENAVLEQVRLILSGMIPKFQEVVQGMKKLRERDLALEKSVESAIISVNNTQLDMLAVYCSHVDRVTRDVVVHDMTATQACTLPETYPSYTGPGSVEDRESKKAPMPKFDSTKELYPHPMAMGPPAPAPKPKGKSKSSRM